MPPGDRPSPNGLVPLSSLAPGREAVIAEVDPASPTGRRLRDLGFVPDTRIVVCRRAPLGDPTEYELRGCRIALRRAEAALVHVRPDPSPSGEEA